MKNLKLSLQFCSHLPKIKKKPNNIPNSSYPLCLKNAGSQKIAGIKESLIKNLNKILKILSIRMKLSKLKTNSLYLKKQNQTLALVFRR